MQVVPQGSRNDYFHKHHLSSMLKFNLRPGIAVSDFAHG